MRWGARTGVKQHDMSDCGPACLVSVCSHYRLRLPISRIRSMAGTHEGGTSLLGLLEAAKNLGFDAKGVKGDRKSLFKIPKPAIAHVVIDGRLQHYVVIYEVRRKYLQVMDPATGRHSRLKWPDFMRRWKGILLLLVPAESFREGNEKISAWAWFLDLVRPHSRILLQAIAGSLILTLLGFSTSVFIRIITDKVLLNSDLRLLNILGLAMLLILTLQLSLSVFKDIFIIRVGQSIDERLILGYQSHLFRLPQRFFDTMKVGEIISRVGDAMKIRMFISHTAMSVVVNLFIVAFSFLIILLYYWKLGLFMASMIPMYLLVFFVTDRLNRSSERKVMESSARVESHLVESLQGIRTLKQFGIESYVLQESEARFLSLLRSGYRSSLNQVFAQSSSFGIQNLFSTGLLWIGSYYVIGSRISPGELLSAYAILGYLTGPVSSLIASNKSIQNALIAADRLFEITDLETSEHLEGSMVEQVVPGDIVFDKVIFKYEKRNKILDAFSATIRCGEITAIIGESGSGKSTILQILQRTYKAQEGVVKINGVNIDYLSDRSLRQLISVVPQRVELFSGTVVENIALGEPRADLAKIIGLISLLEMEGFIESLENGLHHFIEEGGSNLSGGQKQRIAIARALYRDPEILLLDEPASSLDGEAEKALIKAIKDRKKAGKTVVMVSHRTSAISEADQVLWIRDGKLVSHEPVAVACHLKPEPEAKSL